MALTLDKRTTNAEIDVSPNVDTMTATIAVPTTRFGTLEVEEDIIIYLSEGIIGFEKWKRYVVVHHDDTTSFRWLQALDHPGVAFPILEPREFRPDYAPTISNSDAQALQVTADTPVLMFAIITVPPGQPDGMTANLLGPIIINGFTHQGRQVIVQDEGYHTRHRVVDELRRATQVSPVACVVMPQKRERAAQIA